MYSSREAIAKGDEIIKNFDLNEFSATNKIGKINKSAKIESITTIITFVLFF